MVAVPLLRRIIEHVFLVDRGGTPMVHLYRGLPTDADPDLIASMFTAIDSFMNQSFHAMGHGGVRSIELEDYQVAFGRGQYTLMFLLYRGRESNRLERRVAREVREIEARHARLLKDWDGDMDAIAGLKRELEAQWGLTDSGHVVRLQRPPLASHAEPPPARR